MIIKFELEFEQKVKIQNDCLVSYSKSTGVNLNTGFCQQYPKFKSQKNIKKLIFDSLKWILQTLRDVPKYTYKILEKITYFNE
jgi:hypothetical protein